MKDYVTSVTNAQQILESLMQEYPQLFLERGCMESLEIFQRKIRDLKTEVTSEKDSWNQLGLPLQ